MQLTSPRTSGVYRKGCGDSRDKTMRAMKKAFLAATITLLVFAPRGFGQAGASSSTGAGAFPNTLGTKLRKLAAAAQTNNPLINTPLGPAPAWVGSTAYVPGQ